MRDRVTLVGDIGGTNVRFALATFSGSTPVLAEPENFATSDFPSLEEAARTYLDGKSLVAPDTAVLAVAGPVFNGEATFTNLDWQVSERSFSAALDLGATRLINDYAALAFAAPYLRGEDLARLGAAPPSSGGVVAILGAGTGFGVSALVREGEREAIVTSEGGHVAFAPTNEVEIEIWRLLSRRFGRVSVERILSGPGLANLYQALCETHGESAEQATPEAITNAAYADEPRAARAVHVFCEIFGSVAGDFALAYGALGGVFIAGGLMNRIADIADPSVFRARFEAKGRFTDYMKSIPTWRLLRPHVAALQGAARAAASLQASVARISPAPVPSSRARQS